MISDNIAVNASSPLWVAGRNGLTTTAVARGNSIVYMADSRNASKFLDPVKRNKSSTGWMNWMEAFLRGMGKPLNVLGTVAFSGSRTDEWIKNQLDAAIALKPQFICLMGYINNLAQQYPTAATVVAQTVADLKTIFNRINDAGITVIYLAERGANNFTATHLAQMNDINKQVSDYLNYGDASRQPPNVIHIDQTVVMNVASQNGTVALKNAYDGTHDNTPGSKALGYFAAVKLAPYLRELPGHRMRNVSQGKSGLGARSMSTVAGFTGSIAATGTGNTGNIPVNMISKGAGAGISVTYSIQPTTADADGNTWGNEMKVVATSTGAGSFGFYTSLDRTPVALGGSVHGGLEIDVTQATAVSGIYADLEWFPATGSTGPFYDLIPPAGAFGVIDTANMTNFVMEPDPMPITDFTGTPYTNLALNVSFNAAGSITLLTRKWWAEFRK